MNVSGMFLVEGLGHCFGMFSNYVVPFEMSNTEDSISFNASCDSIMIGVRPMMQESAINIYPNPCSDHVVVRGPSEKYQIEVHDSHGNLVLSKAISDGVSVSVDHLPRGLYELSIDLKQGIFRRRLMVIR
jgi:hypothetical protein